MMHSVLIVAVASLVTIALRFLPFMIFNGKRKTPDIILYLGKVLPYAIMGMLVVYCLKDMSFKAAADFVPQIIAGAVVVLSYVWKRNTLLSIGGGTLVYVLLMNFLFV